VPTSPSTSTRSDDGHAVALSLDQFLGAWRVICATGPSPAAATGDGVAYVFSGLPVAFFNVAVVTATGVTADTLRASGAAARDWASPRAVPWLFVTTHERLADGVDADAVLDACGLVRVLPLTGMAADGLTDDATMPSGLDVAIASDGRGCSAIVDVNGAAYGMDLGPAKAVLGEPDFWRGHVPVLGSVGDTPASSAAVLMVDGLRYVAMVATDPAHQRRGFGQAVMQHALATAAARHGASTSVLHATDAGRPVYERMGYRAISTHTLYMDKALAGH
jgi:ribosomal protein S18 acetylase RimI-like enzyme